MGLFAIDEQIVLNVCLDYITNTAIISTVSLFTPIQCGVLEGGRAFPKGGMVVVVGSGL